MKKIFSLTALIISCALSAQQFEWARPMSGGGNEQGSHLAIDASGNVYTVGVFNITTDFDPTSGVNNITAVGDYDIFLTKFDASGNMLWVKTMGGTGADYGYGIALDHNNNIYITGGFEATVDFDPGNGVTNLTSAGDEDIFVCKYDANGNFIWAKQMGGVYKDEAHYISVDDDFNVYTTGDFDIIGDFDPGATSFTLYGQSCTNLFVSKLSGSGNFIWAKNVSGPSDGYALALDGNGGIFVTGIFWGNLDFDMNSGVANLASAGSYDCFIIKMDDNGNYTWGKAYGGTGLDNSGGIALDSAGNIYTTGYFINTVDFDPGAGVSNMTAGNYDAYLLKLDPSGNFAFAKQITGSNAERGYSVDLDAAGNIYLTGDFIGTADFDTGPGTFTISSTWSANSIFVTKLSNTGALIWAVQLGGNGIGHCIRLDNAANIYTTGFYYYQTADFDPGAGVFNMTAVGGNDAFVHKMSQGLAGVAENLNAVTFQLYPNPAGSAIQIISDQQWESYSIANMIGEVVQQGSSSFSVSVENLSPGIYFFQLMNAEGEMRQEKFVKL